MAPAVRPKKQERNIGPSSSSWSKQKQKQGSPPFGKKPVSRCSWNEEWEWEANRERINEALILFRRFLDDKDLLDEVWPEDKGQRSGVGIALHLRAVKAVKKKLGAWVDGGKQVGAVPGIAVGDEFQWRAELIIAGLHHEIEKGIDTLKGINGKPLATSIVDSGRYDNNNNVRVGASEIITYCGEGQNHLDRAGHKPKDQRLSGGNLALKNSMDCKTPVRVIRRIDHPSTSTCTANAKGVNNKNIECGYKFVYDGLYRVVDRWKERGPWGNIIYKFKLRKMHGEGCTLT